MNITRRDALATGAAAITTAAITAPLAIKAALGGDPVIAVAQQLRAANKAWVAADVVFEEAADRAGGSSLTGQEACREIGIESLWQERERAKARYRDLCGRLLDTPATTTRGVLAKLRGFYLDGEIADMRAGGYPDNALPMEYAASVYRDLERLAGGPRPT